MRAGLVCQLLPLVQFYPMILCIKRAKLRGVESFGMLCAAQELGFKSRNGWFVRASADAPIGMSIREYLHLDDYTMEFGITPNRGDCLSVLE